MYLKALNVIGFKSFADKTQVEFHPGVTAIVGPNGCGKSNVLDSIRWVLGEQSAKALRGGQMQDVIFSGSDTRKPLGMAEVSLTFGDCEHELGSDFNEVTITRRLFRDGASEYEINKTPCRLRDIHQLFMDTGVGRTAYSIMEQGKIDQILSARPEDRRAVFEEAAGITKFKSQKKEALRKLEQTEANLLRLEDILREVRRQIGSLQRQAGKARRYQELFAELKDLELSLAQHQYLLLTADILGLEERSTNSKTIHEQLLLAVEEEDGALGRLRSDLEAIEGDAARIREELNNARNAGDRAAQREAVNRTRVDEFGALRENCRIEIAGTEEKVRIQDEQLVALSTQLEKQAIERTAATQVHAEREQTQRRVAQQLAERAETRADRSHELGRIQSTLSNLRNQLVALEAQHKSLLLRAESLRAEQDSLAQRREEAEQRRNAQAAELEEAEHRWNATQSTRTERQQAVSAAQDRVRQAEQQHRECATTHSRLTARADALRQLETTHAETPPATQHLLACAASGELAVRLQGTLSDHIEVEAGAEAAIALLLGEAINALVVDDRAAAETVLEKARAGKGRALLAPLALHRTAHETHSETAATRFIRPDETAAPLVHALLSDAHIVHDLGAAWDLKQSNPTALIATRDGLLLTRDGLIQAGQASETEAGFAVLTRRNERRELEEEIARLTGTLESAASAQTDAVQALGEAMMALEAAQTEAKEAEIAAATRRHTQQTLRQQVSELETAADRANQESARINSQIEADLTRRQSVETALSENEGSVSEIEAALSALESEVTALEQEEVGLRQALVESQIAVATLTQQHQNTESQQKTVHHRLGELRELIATRTREAGDYETRITAAEQEIITAQAEKTEAATAVEDREQALQAALVTKAAHQEKIAEREETLRAERRKLNEVQSAQTECEVKLAEKRIALTHLTDRIQQTYQIALAEMETPARAEGEAEPNWTEIEATVREKRERLDNMGPVNLEAIVEYEELQQRLVFLEGQETDLRTGREQLLQAIAEINQTTQKMFAETFEQVKINFQQIFSELFGGGKASLVLSDENDPLESGIEIVAKPPGKQLQSITLLSGGEKTMTAVALLFSIYMVKPSPFCVLDEMDAPLDESNINRFIRMVQRFTEHSQFVVITHNKRTISMADAIFGVTMQERGVSKLMSVKLTQDGHAQPVRETRPPVTEAPVIASSLDGDAEATAMSSN